MKRFKFVNDEKLKTENVEKFLSTDEKSERAHYLVEASHLVHAEAFTFSYLVQERNKKIENER